MHLLTVCNCNFNNRSSSYQENSPKIRESAEQATKYTNEILEILGQKPKDTEVRVFGFSTGAFLASLCLDFFSETYKKTTLIDVCLAPWNWFFGPKHRASIFGKDGKPVRGEDGEPQTCPIVVRLTEQEKKAKGLDGYNPFPLHKFLLEIIDSMRLEELFDNLAQLPTSKLFRLSLHMEGDKVAGVVDGKSITALDLSPLQCCNGGAPNETLTLEDDINRDNFVEKIREMVEQFFKDHKKISSSPELVGAQSSSATGKEVSRVPS